VKKHLCDEKGRCHCPSWKNGTARMVPSYKLAVFDTFKKEHRCKMCEKTAERWRNNRIASQPDANKQTSD